MNFFHYFDRILRNDSINRAIVSGKKISRKEADMAALYKNDRDYLYFGTSYVSEDNKYYSRENMVNRYFQSLFHSDEGIKCKECGATYPEDFFGFIDEPICAFCLAANPRCYCKQCGKMVTSSVCDIAIKNRHNLGTILDTSKVSKIHNSCIWDALVSNKIDFKIIEYIKDNTLCLDCVKKIIGLKGIFHDKPASPKFRCLTFNLDKNNMLVLRFFPLIPVKDALVDIRDIVKPFLTKKINENLNLEALSLRSPSMGFMPYKNPIHYLDDSSFADLKEALLEMTTDFGSRAEKTVFEVTKSTDTLDIVIILPNTVEQSEIEHVIDAFSESPLAIRQTSKNLLSLNGKPWDPCIWRMYRRKNAQTEFFTCSVYPKINDVNIDIDENISVAISMGIEIRDKKTIFIDED